MSGPLAPASGLRARLYRTRLALAQAAARLHALPRRARLAALWLTAGATLALMFAGRLPQPAAYHGFADTVARLGIPNFTNVASNGAFVVVGVAALAWFWVERRRLLGTRCLDARELALYVILFAVAILVGAGSAYYHYAPTHATLFWDRMPMTLLAAALVSAFFAERFGGRTGLALFSALAISLPGTLVYWRMSGPDGADNVWPYLVGLNGALAVGALAVLLFPSPYTRSGQALVALALYAFAMLFDKVLDPWLYESSGRFMGGHAFKHLMAAFALFWLLWFMLRPRAPRRDARI